MTLALILHHFDESPFSEKLRLILGFKDLAWRSVHVPLVMPKPDVIALTGGYRRTPFVQRGADIWCDTALAARVIDAETPTPSLYPASAPLAPMLAHWLDTTLFWTVVPYVMQPSGIPSLFEASSPEQLKAFAIDRAAFSGNLPRLRPGDAQAQLALHFEALDRQLADGRAWLLGAEASIADFSLAHNLWFVRRAGPLSRIVEAYPALAAYARRVLAIGHGMPREISSAEAVHEAAADPATVPVAVTPGFGLEAGQPVTVAAADYGTDPVAGELVGLDAHEVVIRRTDPRAGTVHVHFPRIGFRLAKADAAKAAP